jgi:phosphatidylglycerophosphate synthase
MPHATSHAPTVTGYFVGQSAVSVWSLSSTERLRRQLRRFGVAEGTATAERALLLRADWVFDDALAADGSWVAANVAMRNLDAVRVALEAGEAPTAMAKLGPEQLTDGYNDALRKREPPYLMRLTAENITAIEARVFAGSYKGVTDFITLHLWPRPARAVTRVCAQLGITPNMVTSLSLVCVLLAMWAFWHGHFAWGLLAAWPMTFLDTVDGKLARVTLQSSRFGDFFDHSIDLLHPPFWWWAWIVGLGAGLPNASLVLTVIVGGYLLQRLEEGLFIAWFKMDMHVWQRFDSWLRLYTARRNPNLAILTVATLFGKPDWGITVVAVWVAVCLVIHAVRLLQALIARRNGPLRSWLA